MPSEKPFRVLDLYCGDSQPVLSALKKQFVGKPVQYVGVDCLTRSSFERKSDDGTFHHRYINALIDPEDPEKIEKLLGQFQDGHFDEIHMHLPGTNSVSNDRSFLNRLSRLLKPRGSMFAFIQSHGSPLFDFPLHNLRHATLDERGLFLENRRNLERAAAESGMRLEQYGANSDVSRRWVTQEKDFEKPNGCEHEKIIDALKLYSPSSGLSFANHFVIFKRIR